MQYRCPRGWSSNFYVLAFCGGLWDGQAVFAQALQVQGNGLGDQLFDLGSRFTRRDATRQIRNIGAITGRSFFDHNGVTHQSSSGNCAWFQMLFRVLIGTSTFNLPATVTRPFLVSCLNCPPLDRMRYQPSASKRLMTSRTFIPSPSKGATSKRVASSLVSGFIGPCSKMTPSISIACRPSNSPMSPKR